MTVPLVSVCHFLTQQFLCALTNKFVFVEVKKTNHGYQNPFFANIMLCHYHDSIRMFSLMLESDTIHGER